MTKIGRNALCPCGSGLKYKRCCEGKDLAQQLDQDTRQLLPEIRLLDTVYNCILAGVWMGFHESGGTLPEMEQLEDFYHEIYGHDLEPDLVEEIVLPLSPLARARLPKPPAELGDEVIDVTPGPQNPA